MWEVYTIGGGALLVDILNGVAMATNSADYGGLIAVVITIGLLWSLFSLAITHDWGSAIKWFILVILVQGVVWLPKGTVLIQDRINPALPAAAVANVPLGLAIVLSVSTTAGDWLTREAETVFSLPDDLKYQRNGMIFGARLMREVTQARITNTEFSRNVTEFVQQCVTYDILLGHTPMEALAQATDLWEAVTETYPTSPARSVEYITTGGRTIISCPDAATALSSLWAAEIDRAAQRFGLSALPYLAPAAAKTQILGNLPVAHEFLTGISEDASSILKQAMVMNAFDAATEASLAESGNTAAIVAYTQTRAEAQTAASYNATARQAEKFVPLLHIVLTAIFVGAFMIVFPIMLLPDGIGVAKKFAYFFAYMASWPPLFAILHRIMMGTSAQWTSAASTTSSGAHGFALTTLYDIQIVNADIAAIAGYLSISVPFLSMALVSGAGSIGGLATSMLAIPQRAAGQAAEEATAGNVNMGNLSVDNRSLGMESAYQKNTGGSFDGYNMRTTGADGETITTTGSGRTVLDASGSQSNLPVSLGMGSQMSSELRQQASESQRLGESYRTQAAESRAGTFSSIAEFATSRNAGQAFKDEAGVSLSGNQQEAFTAINRAAEDFSRQTGHTKEESAQLLAAVSAGAQVPGFGILQGSIKGEMNVGGRGTSTDTVQKAQNFAKERNLQQSFDVAERAFADQSHAFNHGETNDFADRISAQSQQTRSLEQSSALEFDKSKQYEQAATRAETNSAHIDRQLAQPFVQWLAQQPYRGNPLGINTANSLLTSTNPGDRALVDDYARRFVRQEAAQLLTSLSQPQALGVDKATYDTRAGQLAAATSTAAPGLALVYDRAAEAGVGPTDTIDQSPRDKSALDREGYRQAVDGENIALRNQAAPAVQGVKQDMGSSVLTSASTGFGGAVSDSVDSIGDLAQTVGNAAVGLGQAAANAAVGLGQSVTNAASNMLPSISLPPPPPLPPVQPSVLSGVPALNSLGTVRPGPQATSGLLGGGVSLPVSSGPPGQNGVVSTGQAATLTPLFTTQGSRITQPHTAAGQGSQPSTIYGGVFGPSEQNVSGGQTALALSGQPPAAGASVSAPATQSQVLQAAPEQVRQRPADGVGSPTPELPSSNSPPATNSVAASSLPASGPSTATDQRTADPTGQQPAAGSSQSTPVGQAPELQTAPEQVRQRPADGVGSPTPELPSSNSPPATNSVAASSVPASGPSTATDQRTVNPTGQQPVPESSLNTPASEEPKPIRPGPSFVPAQLAVHRSEGPVLSPLSGQPTSVQHVSPIGKDIPKQR
jgi:conjugal transfer mating pair stabilization protein TraG